MAPPPDVLAGWGIVTPTSTQARRAPSVSTPRILSSRSIVLLYIAASVAWIALSDRIAAALFANIGALTVVSTLKGWGFVAITGLLLAVMLQRHDRAQADRSQELAASERRFRLLAEHAQDVVFRWILDPAPALEYLSPAVERVLGYPAAAFAHDPGLLLRLVHPDDRALFELSASSAEAQTFVVRLRHADGHWVWLEQRSSLVRDDAGEPAALEGVARDVTEQRRTEAALARVNRAQRTLSAAGTALVRADQELPLLEAICRIAVGEGGYRFAWVGYCEDDAAGIVRPVAHAGHEEGYLAQVQISWRDVPTGRGPTGTAIREGRPVVARHIATDPVMAPWRGEAGARGYASSVAFPLLGRGGILGALTIYAAEPDAFGPDEVALLEALAADLSYGVQALRTRAAQDREQERMRERVQIARALAALRPQVTPEETADAICRQIVQLSEAAAAALLTFDAVGAAPLGGAARGGGALALRRLSVGRARHLREHALEGPWVEGWRAGQAQPFSRALQALGIRALAYAPLLIADEVVGLLEVGSATPRATEGLTERLPALAEFASIAGAVLGPTIASRAEQRRSRERLQAIIAGAAFHPVFQPIVELGSLAVVGYEALTRFADGTPPEAQFDQARTVGLGLDLEIAVLREALRQAAALPPAPWLNVNVSPAVILAGEPLRSLLAGHRGQLVLEVTEHEVIADYAAFRAAVEALGPSVRIAVDDAGAGFASLRHIVELRPQIVKIDRSLVAGLDADPARQALLAGLRHFADLQACSLIAEGIETEAELAALVSLGVQAGQGYLLGRPVPLPVRDPMPAA